MSEFVLRPRFRFEVDLAESKVVEIIKKEVDKLEPGQFSSTIVQAHLLLKIHPSKKHFWSPQMDVTVEEIEENKTLIRCLIAPEASVWTMFMFIYTITGFAAFIGLMLGLSQWSLEREVWGFYVFLGSLMLGILFYFVAQFGKKLGKDEMILLTKIIDNIVWK